MREKAKKKGVDSIVSPETPARLPAPPLQQEVAVSVPPSPAPPSAEKAPAGPVAEKETEPRQAAAPQSGPMSSSASAAPAEGGAGNAPKDDAIARSDGPRLPLIALPDRRFFRQLGNFLLRREGGSVRKPTPEAEAARMAGSLPQTTPDEAADDVVRLPDDGDTGEADEPDAAGAPIDESADAEKRTPAVATDEETTTPRAPPSLPTLADRSSSAPGPRKALEIPPAAKTAAPPSRVRRGHRRRG
jgi:hypothetical protein